MASLVGRRFESRRGWLTVFLSVALLWICVGTRPSLAQTEAKPSLEYQIKASSIYNFLYFIGWPEQAFARSEALNICIVGRDQFGSAADVLEGEVISGRRINVEKIESYERSRVETCHVAFFSRSVPRQQLREALADLRDQNVLTIGEHRDFITQGGIINFIVQDDRLQFEISRQALREARLTASEQLLSLSR